MSDLARLRVLVADSNVHTRTIMVSVLKGLRVRAVTEARDGSDALEVLRRNPIDVAIADSEMGPIDGLSFTRLLRTSPDSPRPALPVILVTGRPDIDLIEEARDAGVHEILLKPLNIRALENRLRRAMVPRPFIRCESYVGPDRRRRRDLGYAGPERRAVEQPGLARAAS